MLVPLMTPHVTKLCFFVGFYLVTTSQTSIHGEHSNYVDDEDSPGEPLFLTPLIRNNRIQEAREKARVFGLDDDISSYSGYITVNEDFNSNLFFWFFPAKVEAATAPVIVYLNGGPGLPSLMTIFVENGPFTVDEKGRLSVREHTWITHHSVVYIDSPVGTGFSFTDQDDGYARNGSQVSQDLYKCLIQYFTMFPEYKNNDLFIAGESYGGKYVPRLGEKIHLENQQSDFKLNLKGVMIGDGFTDPASMMCYSDLFYQMGSVNFQSRNNLKHKENAVRILIEQEKWNEASTALSNVLKYCTLVTGYNYLYNILQTDFPKDSFYYFTFVDSNKVRKMLHVGRTTIKQIASKVQSNLHEDFAKSAKPSVETLLRSGYRVLYYNGLLDIIVNYCGTMNFLHSLDWDGIEGFQSVQRKLWYVDGNLAGYVQEGETLTFVGIRNAGHMVPYEQPKMAELLIRNFASGSHLIE